MEDWLTHAFTSPGAFNVGWRTSVIRLLYLVFQGRRRRCCRLVILFSVDKTFYAGLLSASLGCILSPDE